MIVCIYHIIYQGVLLALKNSRFLSLRILVWLVSAHIFLCRSLGLSEWLQLLAGRSFQQVTHGKSYKSRGEEPNYLATGPGFLLLPLLLLILILKFELGAKGKNCLSSNCRITSCSRRQLWSFLQMSRDEPAGENRESGWRCTLLWLRLLHLHWD